MPIRVKCSCGKTLTAPDNLAGKMGRCPACGARFTIPWPSYDVEGAAQQAVAGGPMPAPGAQPGMTAGPPVQPVPPGTGPGYATYPSPQPTVMPGQQAPQQPQPGMVSPPPAATLRPAAALAPQPPQAPSSAWVPAPQVQPGPVEQMPQAQAAAEAGRSPGQRLVVSLFVIFGAFALAAVSFFVVVKLCPAGTGNQGADFYADLLAAMRQAVPAPAPETEGTPPEEAPGETTPEPATGAEPEAPAPVEEPPVPTPAPAPNPLVGKWQQVGGIAPETIEFGADGTVTRTIGTTPIPGKHKPLDGGKLHLQWQAGSPTVLDIKIADDTLTLSQAGSSVTYKKVK